MQVILPDNIYFLYLGVLSFCKPFSKHGVAVPPLVSVKKSSGRFFADITEEQKQESPLKNLEVLKALICAKKKKINLPCSAKEHNQKRPIESSDMGG